MKNKENWKPTKFIYKKGKLRASRDEKQVSYSSRLVADLIGRFYDSVLKKYAKGNLLDLGCGNVPLYDAYNSFVIDNICVDWGNSFHRNEFLDMKADLNKTLEISDNRFDTIVLSDVLEHIKEPKLLWNEMYRILKNNGVLIMNVPFFYWLHEEPYDYYRYTKYSLRVMAEESGFEVVEIKPLGGAPEILTDITAKTIRMIPLIGKPISIIIQKLTWLFINSRVGNKISKLTCDKFPVGYGLIAKKTIHNKN